MIIYTGRFQPFHNGHLSFIEKLVSGFPNEQICVAVIKKSKMVDEYKDEFDKVVDAEWKKKNFVFESEETVELIRKILENRFPERFKSNMILCCDMPRASVQTWHEVEEIFGDDRVWAFSLNEGKVDEWEEKKCEFYSSMGDRTVRVKIQKDVNGSDIRKHIENKNSSALKKLVPPETLEFLN